MKTSLAWIPAVALMLGAGCQDADTLPSPPESTLLRFTVPDSEYSGSYGNTIFISDLTQRNEPSIMEVLPGNNEIELSRNGIFVLTFLEIPDLVTRARGSRSVTGAISTIGCLEIVAAGLASIPITNGAGSAIGLGTLSSNGSSITSAIPLPELESGTGYSESQLRLIGGFDVKSIRSKNPDIDRNGQLDSDQNLAWSMYQRIVFFIDMDDYDFESGAFDTAKYPDTTRFAPGDIWIIFDNNFIDPLDRPITLRVPESIGMTIQGVPTLDVPYYQTDDGGQFWFLVKNYNDEHNSTPPYNGKWSLSVGGVEEAYVIDNVRFNDTTWNYDGLYIPLIRIDKSPDGTYDRVRWRWVRVERDIFITVGIDEADDLGLITGANIRFESRQPVSLRPYFEALTSDIQDIDQENILVSMSAIIGGADSLDLKSYLMTDANIVQHQASCMDINGNMYQFHYLTPNDLYSNP